MHQPQSGSQDDTGSTSLREIRRSALDDRAPHRAFGACGSRTLRLLQCDFRRESQGTIVNSAYPDHQANAIAATPRTRWIIGAVVAVFVASIAGATAVVLHGRGDDAAAQQRVAEVEERGASVMPFDQNATMHRFTKTANGGIETVTANDPKDATQIDLVQQHLARERDLFADGNFSDPMAIHGMDMPGLSDLQQGAAAGRLRIAYAGLANGARLTYSTSDADLLDALHKWFDAQLMDHGSHAMP
jgi:hypothetical protein